MNRSGRAVRLATLTAVLVASSGTNALAAELDAGADALPLLTSRSTLVLEVIDSALVAQPNPALQLFRIHAGACLRGKPAADQFLVLEIPWLGKSSAEELEHSFAFLRGPLSKDEKEVWHVTVSEPMYMLVAGKGGHVAISPQRRQAVIEYFGTGGPAPTPTARTWALKYLSNEDSFLQYSAVDQLRRFRDDNVLESLRNAVVQKKLTEDNQLLAVGTIAAAGTSFSTQMLTAIAGNTALAKAVRQESILHLTFLPGGPAQLAAWKTSPDLLLRTTSGVALEQRNQFSPP